MILESLVGLSLVVSVAVEPGSQPTLGSAPTAMTMQKKNVIMQPLVRSATECVVRAVAADPRMRSGSQDLRDMIVESMPSCAERMRAMIDTHDQLFGDGSGETFFLGPYLDALPATVLKAVKETIQ